MTLTITLQPELEERFRIEAISRGLTVEQLAACRLEEAELLWRIRTASPEAEARDLHRLLRRQRAGTATGAEQTRLQALLDDREQSAAQRLEDLAKLSCLRSMPLRRVMEELGIRPIPPR